MDTPESLKPKILELLGKHGKMSLGELQKALKIKRPDYMDQNQHKTPLNQALIQLRDSGQISAPNKAHGDPVFMKANFDEKIVAKELLKVAKILASTVKADTLPEDEEWAPHEKKGEWNLIISKSRATRWDYFLKNPVGGGGGSSSYSSVNAAIQAAIGRGVSGNYGKDKVWVIVQEWDGDKYVQKKMQWLPIKEQEKW